MKSAKATVESGNGSIPRASGPTSIQLSHRIMQKNAKIKSPFENNKKEYGASFNQSISPPKRKVFYPK